MKLAPNHRFVHVREAFEKKTTLTDEKEIALLQFLEGKSKNETVARAYDINLRLYKREVMESALLAGVSPKEIDAILKIPPAITELYAHLFFDLKVFEDELDKIEYGHTYTATEFGASWKKYAVTNGKASMLIRMSRGSAKISPAEIQNDIRTTAYMQALSAKNNPVDSETTKNAYRWAQLALKAALEGDEDTTSDVEELMMALDTEDETVNEESSGLKPEDILH